MKRLMTLLVALTVVAIIAAPAFAEVQNVKVSGDIKSAGVYRNHYCLLNSGNSNSSGDNNNFLFTQARLRVDADLTDNVMAVIRLLTEWDWGTEDMTYSDGDDFDMDLAYVTLKEVFYQPLTVTVGRQELRYGNAFVIGDPDTNTTSKDTNLTATDFSKRKSFDSVRAVLDYNPWTIDMIFAKIDETNLSKDDEDLYGANVAYEFENYDAEAEAYVFFNRDDNEATPAASTDAFTAGHEIYTMGIRGSVEPIENLSLMGELAFQRGDYDNTSSSAQRDQDAMAYQIGGNYLFPEAAWEPLVKVSWTHYDGENSANDGEHEAWLPMYEDQSHGIVANYILGGVNGGQNSNADILNIGASGIPMEDLTVSADIYWFWLDEKLVTSANSAASGNGALEWRNLTESSYYLNADDELGYEIDLALNYDYTEDVQMGLSCGWFVPGEAFEGKSGSDTNDETALQVMATLDVMF